MKQEINMESIEQWRKLASGKFPSFSGIINSVDIGFDRSGTKTAEAEEGKININKNFISKLKEDEQLFIIMHEVCHIAFGHVGEIADKDPECWNIACDSVINTWLKDQGMSLPSDAIYMPDAKKCDSAEELYIKLVKRKEQGKSPVAEIDDNAMPEKDWPEFGAAGKIHDDHSGWEAEAEKIKQGKIQKPKKLLHPKSKSFLINSQTVSKLRESKELGSIAHNEIDTGNEKR